MKWILRVLLVAFVVAANGCGQVCTAIQKPGIVLTIVDGATGNPIEEAMVIATDGSYSETVSLPGVPPSPGFAALAYERAGTYRVEVLLRDTFPGLCHRSECPGMTAMSRQLH
jgi:hypothetical protein